MDIATKPAHAPAEHPPVALGKVGVLLINLGTPEALTTGAVRKYLAEFLSDRRVVDYPALVWQPVLRGIILNTRPAKTKKAYAEIWDQETGESPLRRYTREQAEKLAARMPEGVHVDWAMRYGVPGTAETLDRMQAAGCDRILLVPLYPQYSATTTGTACDAAYAWAMKKPWMPAFRTMPAFHDDDGLIEALADTCRRHTDETTERVILSFHGLPERYFKQGDPYHCHCQKTARLMREKLGWTTEFAPLAFQSKFGPETWLGPSTEDLVEEAAKEGLKNIAVITPGFVSDCIETLEEVGLGLAETFEEHGGESLKAIPCLNSSDAFIDLLERLCLRELQGWVAS
ncbi:ferrochelatase [Parvularcula sp. ZS-1/3]|uniref:Ferrochelatase n=2 Tax=Parvularcula mediterranea TaxID=2732508 RepID=A0A7Y3RKI7_9PROT|nr:ferrochelatase [Parvularcula mediterranea]